MLGRQPAARVPVNAPQRPQRAVAREPVVPVPNPENLREEPEPNVDDVPRVPPPDEPEAPPPEQAQTQAPEGVPKTRAEYLQQLATSWGPTWTTGPTWELGAVSTTFQVSVASCYQQGDTNNALHQPARNERDRRAYKWTERYAFDAADNLVWYRDDDDRIHYRDGRLCEVPPWAGPRDEDEELDTRLAFNTHVKNYLTETFGEDAARVLRPDTTLYYRMEWLRGKKEMTLNFTSDFLREHLQYGNPFGAIAPFVPAPGVWAFMQGQDELLPVTSGALLQLVRDYYLSMWPMERYRPLDDAFLADNMERFMEFSSDSEADVELRRQSYALHKFHDECKELTHIDSTASFVLLIDHVVKHDVGPAEPVAPAEQAMGDVGHVPQLLSNRHVRIQVNPAATTLAEWIVKPDVATQEARDGLPVCVMDDFIKTWAGPITDAWAMGHGQCVHVPAVFMDQNVPSFTVARILEFLGVTDGTRLTIDQHKTLLAAFGIGADWYDESGRIIDSLRSTTHKIVPERAHFAVKNDHCYRLNAELRTLDNRRDADVEIVNEVPSDKYPLTKNKSVRVFLEKADDIIRVDRSEYAKGTRFDIRLNEPLHGFLKTLRTTCSLDPDVAFSGAGTAPTRVSFNVDGHTLTFQNPISAGCLQVAVDQCVPDAAYLDRYEDLSRALFESVVRPKNLSTFGPEFMDWLKVDNRGPLKGRISGLGDTMADDYRFDEFHLDGDEEGFAGLAPAFETICQTTEVDICRAYPSALRAMDYLPVCIETDRPKTYDGHELEDWAIYDVERKRELYEMPIAVRVLLNHRTNRMTGRTLRRFWDKIHAYVEINSYFRPYRLIPNHACKYIDSILRDDMLTPEHKKHMLVHAIGRMGKKYNSKQTQKLFSTEGEAQYARTILKGTVTRYPYEFYRDDVTGNSTADEWFVLKGDEKKTRLRTGFSLVHFYMLCASRGDLAQTCFDLAAEGHEVQALNTDAAYIYGTYRTEPLDKTDPANLGKRSRTPKAMPDYVLQWGDHNVPWSEPEPVPLVNITLKNEKSCHELGSLLKTTRHVLMLGKTPGTGKTTMALNTINKQHSTMKPCIMFVPNNHRRKEQLHAGVEYVDTFAKAFGQRFDDDGGSVMVGGEYCYRGDKTKPWSFYKSVVMDEALSLDADARAILRRLIVKLADMGIVVIATGDETQLLIEHDINPAVDLPAYVRELARENFPTAVILETPKRFPLANDKEIVLGLDERLNAVKWDAPHDERHASMLEFLRPYKFKWVDAADVPDNAHVITYTNELRARINNVMHYRTHTLPFEVGGMLVYRNRSRKQGDATLYKNYWYEIDSVTANDVTIHEEDSPDVTFTLSRETMGKWFTYTYASTVHSAQGSTYDGPVAIGGLFHPYVTKNWVKVALTRAKYPRRDTYIIRGAAPPAVDVAAIGAQIARHLENDEQDGRVVDEPITVDWVLARDVEQRGRCALCAEPYEMLRVGVAPTNASASVDRIGHRGHEVGNCQICCRGCNFSKKNKLV